MTRKPATAIVEEIREKWAHRHNSLDPELVPTDRIMQRWASSVGDDGERASWGEDMRESRAPPLDDETAVTVDRIVQALIPKYRRLAVRWYKGNSPRQAIANDLGLPRTTLYLEWRAMLWYLRGRFHGVGIDC